MKYYNRIHIHTDKAKYTYEKEIYASKNLKDAYMDGEVVAEEVVKFEVASKSKKIPDILGPRYLPIISNRFKIILEGLSDTVNYQFIRAVVNQDENGNSFWALNLLNHISCLDPENSEFETFVPGGKSIQRITKLQMYLDKVGNRNLFRMKEYPMLLFVSPLLEKLMKENELIGYRIGNTDNPKMD